MPKWASISEKGQNALVFAILVKRSFDEHGNSKLHCVKETKELTGIGLKEAKELMDDVFEVAKALNAPISSGLYFLLKSCDFDVEALIRNSIVEAGSVENAETELLDSYTSIYSEEILKQLFGKLPIKRGELQFEFPSFQNGRPVTLFDNLFECLANGSIRVVTIEIGKKHEPEYINFKMLLMRFQLALSELTIAMEKEMDKLMKSFNYDKAMANLLLPVFAMSFTCEWRKTHPESTCARFTDEEFFMFLGIVTKIQVM